MWRASFVILSLVAFLAFPGAVYGKKKSPVGRPASKPPVYKKFKNKKQKTAKFGLPKPS
ncbi:hypothetical protein [Bryobacter aggregatus]|uniref:hypothetical protein n=1 Tax=Bryobacter aggregatus TaxID=360054 RepID=UPI0012BA973D|nr:hypothetical protein [Bryobacter aggregatus]